MGQSELIETNLSRPATRISTLIDMFFEPRTAFNSIALGVDWILPLLIIICLRVSTLFVYYSPSVKPLTLLATVVLEAFMVVLPTFLIAIYSLGLFTIFGLPTQISKLFSAVVHSYLVSYTVTWIASVVWKIWIDTQAIRPMDQMLTHLGWIISVDENRYLNHVLRSIDLSSAIFLVLLTFGLHMVVKGSTLRLSAYIILGGWFVKLLITTGIKIAVS